MCGPAAPIVMAAAAVASTAISAVGQIQAGKAQKAMANFNAQQREEAAKYNAARQQDRAQRLLATARVNIAKSGVDASGSPLDVMTDSAMEAELDRQAILRQAANQAALHRMEGRAAMRRGYFGAATSLLSGVGRAAGFFGGAASRAPGSGWADGAPDYV